MRKAGEWSSKLIACHSDYSTQHVLNELNNATEDLVVLSFENGNEHPFGHADAELGKSLASLPHSGKLSLAYTNGLVSGRDLAILLRCFFVVTGPDAVLATGFGRPAAAAIYAAAAHRVGTTAAEKALFGPTPLNSVDAHAVGLTWIAADLAEATTMAKSCFSTLLGVARSNLITWPFIFEAEQALIDA